MLMEFLVYVKTTWQIFASTKTFKDAHEHREVLLYLDTLCLMAG